MLIVVVSVAMESKLRESNVMMESIMDCLMDVQPNVSILSLGLLSK